MRRLAVLAVAAFWTGSTIHADEPVYPGAAWATKSPAEAGLSAERLAAFSDYVGGFGCVVRHGYMVYTWGDASRRMDVASAAKPVYAHLLLKAVEDGRIFSLDEPVNKWEPRLKRVNAGLGCKDSRITWRHMANQVSCYGLVEEPGTAYAYNDWQMSLLWDTLFTKVYGATFLTVDSQVLHPLLTDLIGCQDNPTFLAFGVKDRPGRLGISPRDFARFGLLYLRGGRWNGRQLLSPEYARMAVSDPLPNSVPRAGSEAAEMIPGQRSIGSKRIPDNQTDHMGSYSWLWWINGVDREGRRHWPAAPVDTFGCFGHGGKRAMVVLPGLDLIMSWNDTRIDSRERENEAFRLLLTAVSVAASLPATVGPQPVMAFDIPREPGDQPNGSGGLITVDPENPAWPRYVPAGGKDERSFLMCGPGDPEDFLYRGKLNPDGTRDGDQMQLIEKLKRTGANCIYLMAVRSHGGDGDATHNPFLGHDPAAGVNLAALDQWEQWFTAMDHNRIVTYFFLYDDSARPWNTGDDVGEQERQFIASLVNRFEHHGHLIWCIAEEYAERLTAERVRRIAALIRAEDDYDHPVAVHKNHGLDFSEFADDPNLDQFAIQYNVPTAEELHAGVVQAWQDAKGRYSLNLAEAANWGSGAESRRKCWACAMGGASVMILRMDIAGTPEEDLRDCGNVVRFFERVDLRGMEPHDELAFGGTRYVLALPGERYVAYAADGRARMGLRNMRAGRYRYSWFDCLTGQEVLQESVDVTDGSQAWPRPAGIGDEAAVYIRRIGQ